VSVSASASAAPASFAIAAERRAVVESSFIPTTASA